MQFVRKPLQSPLSLSWCGGGGVMATDWNAAVFQILQPSGCGQQCDRVRAFFCVAGSKICTKAFVHYAKLNHTIQSSFTLYGAPPHYTELIHYE